MTGMHPAGMATAMAAVVACLSTASTDTPARHLVGRAAVKGAVSHRLLVSVPRGAGPRDTTCVPTVVPCNYAHLYDGSFAWHITLSGSRSQYREDVTINVLHGSAVCSGSTVEFDPAATPQTVRGTITGPGLIGVEFVRDSADALVYRIVGSCPTPSSINGPSRPAELGNSQTQESYQQPASAVGIDLAGSNGYPAPESDPVNGVTGTVRVSWALKRW